MVAVDGDVVAVDVADGDDLHAAVRGRGMELHADFQHVDAFEQAAIEGADQFRAVLAVGFFRLDADVELVAGLLADQGLLQTDDDVAGTVQVDQRSAARRAVDHLAGVVGEGIVDGDSLVGGDQHEGGTFAKD
ncbi:hypothetical protein D9M69_460400 [compost metagenome]